MLALYSPDGTRVTGEGPAHADGVVDDATGGQVASDADADGGLAVAVPVTDGTTVTGVIRAASPYPGVWLRIAGAWGVMLALGIAAVLVTWLVACGTVLAHVIRAARARPVEALRYE